jgi:hypothetical protein
MNKKEKDNPAKKPLYQGPDSQAPYPLHLSSPKIKPIDKRLVKGNALEVMGHQAQQQIDILRKQAELLMLQAKEIEERVKVSHQIYEADLNFEPIIGTTYHMYEKNGRTILSLVAPNEWGKLPFDAFRCSVKLLADKSWEIIKDSKKEE